MCSAAAVLGFAALQSTVYAATDKQTAVHDNAKMHAKTMHGRPLSAAPNRQIVKRIDEMLSWQVDNSSGATGNQTSSSSSSKHDKNDINHIITQFEQAIAPYQSDVHPKRIKHPANAFANDTSANTSNGTGSSGSSGDVSITLAQSLADYQAATKDDVQSQSQFESAVSGYIAAMQEAVSESKSKLLSSQESSSTEVISYLEDALYYQKAVDSGVDQLRAAAAKKQPSALIPILQQMVEYEQQKVADIQEATKILQDATTTLSKNL